MTIVAEKIDQAVALLQELDLDCWLTFVRESDVNGDPMLAYVLGAPVTWVSAFLVCRSGATWAVVGQGDRQTVDELGRYQHVSSYVKDFREELTRVLARLDPASIAINYSPTSEVADGLTHGMFLTLRGLLESLGLADRLVSAEVLIARLRGRKTPTELHRLGRAVTEALEIFEIGHRAMRPGLSERGLADVMLAEAARRGLPSAWSSEICPAVFSGPEARDLHARPSGRPLTPGHLLYVDFGVRWEGYCSDLQRTYYVRERDGGVPAEVQRGFDTLVEAIDAARRAMRPGVQGLEIDTLVREALNAAGYEDFPHALGHQVGRFAHDGSALLGPAWEKYAGRPREPLEAGMVFTIEPRLYVPERGTVSIEEMVVITPDGAEFLGPPQTSLLLV
jgi:Xaa-Pro aminopeptidase